MILSASEGQAADLVSFDAISVFVSRMFRQSPGRFPSPVDVKRHFSSIVRTTIDSMRHFSGRCRFQSAPFRRRLELGARKRKAQGYSRSFDDKVVSI